MPKRKSSFEIDTVIKLNLKLKKDVINQLETFDQTKNKDLLIQLNELTKFKKKKIEKNEIGSETKIFKIKKIIDLLCKIDCYNLVKKPDNDLRLEIDKLKEEIKKDLILSEFEFYENNEEDESINESNYDNESICEETNYYLNEEIIVESNYNLNESINELNNEPINQTTNNEPVNQTTNYEPVNQTTNNEKSMDELNNDLLIYDIWPIIFRNLSINDLLNCRLVSRKFKEFSDNGIDKLVISQPNSVFNEYYWYYNNKSIEVNEIISLKCFNSIRSIFNLDKNLKYLKIYDKKFNFKKLSSLINLESLEFGEDFEYLDFVEALESLEFDEEDLEKDNQKIINLNNLKFFASNINLSIKLNTPKLEKIQFKDFDCIKSIINQESIKHLITRNCYHRLKIFKNLEIIEFRNTPSTVDENLLNLFKNLKQLKINYIYGPAYSFGVVKNGLIGILNKKKIDIYLEGVKIENVDKFNELVDASKDDSFWKFRMNNYDLLDLNLPFIERLNYEKLEECFNNIKNDLPSTFFNKFFNINYVYLSVLKDVDNLNWFCNNLKNLRKLDIL